jgi:hypothetical protein
MTYANDAGDVRDGVGRGVTLGDDVIMKSFPSLRNRDKCRLHAYWDKLEDI